MPPNLPQKKGPPSSDEVWVEKKSGRKVRVSSCTRGVVMFFAMGPGDGGLMSWEKFSNEFEREAE